MSTNWPPRPNPQELPPDADLLPEEFIAIIQNLAADNFMEIEDAANREDPVIELEGTPILEGRLINRVAAYSRPSLAHKDRNEDRVGISQNGRLMVAVDGMGGHGGSHVAAHIVLHVISECLGNQPVEMTNEEADMLLQNTMVAANSAVTWYNQMRSADPNQKDFFVGATAAVAWLYKKVGDASNPDGEWRLLTTNSGDGRAYLWYPGMAELEHATIDQNGITGWDEAKQKRFAAAQKRSDLTDQEWAVFEQMYRVDGMGTLPFHPGQMNRYPVDPGLRILVCTDGMHDVESDPEIIEMFERGLLPIDTLKELSKAVGAHNKKELTRVEMSDGRVEYIYNRNRVRAKEDDRSGVYGVIWQS